MWGRYTTACRSGRDGSSLFAGPVRLSGMIVAAPRSEIPHQHHIQSLVSIMPGNEFSVVTQRTLSEPPFRRLGTSPGSEDISCTRSTCLAIQFYVTRSPVISFRSHAISILTDHMTRTCDLSDATESLPPATASTVRDASTPEEHGLAARRDGTDANTCPDASTRTPAGVPKRDTIIVDRCDRASAAHRLRQRSPAHPSSPQHCCYGCRALGPSRSCPAVERVAANVSIVPGCVRKGMAWRGGAHLVAGSPRRRPRSRRAPRAPTSSAPSSQRSPSTLRIALRWQKVLPHSTARSISQETFEGAKGPQACTRSIRSMSYGARGSGGRSEQRESGVHLCTDCGSKPGSAAGCTILT